jgi:hypothetical protein
MRVLPGIAALAALGACKHAPVPTQEPIDPEPPVSASVAGARPPDPVAATSDAGLPPVEASSFSLECAGPSALAWSQGPPRACRIRGTVRASRTVVLQEGDPAHILGGGSRGAILGRELAIEPDDALPCRTPLDADHPSDALPQASYADLERAGLVVVLGAARIAPKLEVGARLCGWSRLVGQPGLHYPAGWEGELTDASGTLLGVASFTLDRRSPATLRRAWRFSREGAIRRMPMGEGGAFVFHENVRVLHGGASAVSIGGAEAILRAKDGTFAVTAVSDLTEGDTAVFVGRHDGFDFAALRIAD